LPGGWPRLSRELDIRFSIGMIPKAAEVRLTPADRAALQSLVCTIAQPEVSKLPSKDVGFAPGAVVRWIIQHWQSRVESRLFRPSSDADQTRT
jgi:hypothetical protein